MKSLMRLDPFRTLRRWDPFDEFRSMQTEMDRLFDRLIGGETSTMQYGGLWAPSVESYLKEGNMVIKAEIPGVEAKDLDVSVTDRELIIKGERNVEKDEKKKDYTYREISYGTFERRLVLPEGAKSDELKAKFANGILEITVPVPSVPKARRIEIEAEKEAKHLESEQIKKAA